MLHTRYEAYADFVEPTKLNYVLVAGSSRCRGCPRGGDDRVAMVFARRGTAQSSGGGSAVRPL